MSQSETPLILQEKYHYTPKDFYSDNAQLRYLNAETRYELQVAKDECQRLTNEYRRLTDGYRRLKDRETQLFHELTAVYNSRSYRLSEFMASTKRFFTPKRSK